MGEKPITLAPIKQYFTRFVKHFLLQSNFISFFLLLTWKICSSFQHKYLAHVIEQPIFRIPNILFIYFFIDFFVKHIFFEARLERVIDGAADCWSYF